MARVAGFSAGFASGAETLDSSKVRSTTVARAQKVGLVRVTRYGHTAGYVTSPDLLEDLQAQAAQRAELLDQLLAARPLLQAAVRLGIDPAEAVAVLVRPTENGLDVAALAEVVAAAADDLDAARVARERLQAPAGDDITLDELAAELGIDIAARREAVRAGQVEANIATS